VGFEIERLGAEKRRDCLLDSRIMVANGKGRVAAIAAPFRGGWPDIFRVVSIPPAIMIPGRVRDDLHPRARGSTTPCFSSRSRQSSASSKPNLAIYAPAESVVRAPELSRYSTGGGPKYLLSMRSHSKGPPASDPGATT